ncbi:sn-glycerol-3-phosphate ABC transporter permease UgpE [Basilea psittacipulmonis]|uniref:sn-glycerol-3-phosphate transport system permease protein UgpE n=1 Tax=Basilea psittacipulmonis DSM 24701 TaxID=1072685 RepID=A0A077DHB3_9BURK|nr:sn-glycerol-3-phosphate ABC transporter permease UgpE [Basilea psittacipulmonis]AIL32538.1 glycerol-3-phosphate transporter membrane protein [Basilea psittacipulmonis DSM 24701]
MVERRPWLTATSHIILILGVLVIAFPIYVAFVASTQDLASVTKPPISLIPGLDLFKNYSQVLFETSSLSKTSVSQMLWSSFIIAIIITVGKIVISMLSAYAVVYFRFRFRMLCFWMIFVTLMLPVEVRISPTFQVVSSFGLADSYAGLTLPLIASATATFLFRQFFMTVPNELVEAARIDGAGPMRFFKDILFPLSYTTIAALFVIQFIYGWNQYLWPLVINNSTEHTPIVVGIRSMMGNGDSLTPWNQIMATSILAMLPPALVVIVAQRWFVKGLVDTEK